MSKRPAPEIAVVGYGLTAQEALRIVPDLLPDSRVTVFGNRSVGQETAFGPIQALPDTGVPEVDYAMLHTEADVSEELAQRFTEAGVTVVDLSTRYRMEADPLVVAPFNGDALTGEEELLPNPNCTTAIMLTALGPLHREFGIDRLIVKSDQAVSGMGAEGEQRLRAQAATELSAGASSATDSLAFNVHAEISGEAEKVGQETRKILAKPSVSVSARCTRASVFVSHCVDVTVFTETPVTADGLDRLLESAPGLDYWRAEYPTPKDAAGRDEVLVGPVWIDPANPRELRMWIVGDNLRRGAALNALEIVQRHQALRVAE